MTARLHLISALGAVLLLSACGESKTPPAPAVKAAPEAGRLTIRAQTVADLKPVPATLTTRDMAEARARISGTLVALSVKEGDVVRQGQMIGRIKDDRLSLQTGAFDAQVAAAAAEAARAQADLSRTRDLFSHGVYAQARLDQVEAQAKAANANLTAARAQRGASAELSAQGAILAPATGRILVADVPVGSVVMPGQSVARITAGPLVVRIELPEGQARALKVGDTVDLAAEDLRGVAARGTIAQIYPSITGGQVTADVTAPNLPGDLIGQRVRAVIKIGERQAIVIPRRYVATRFGVDYARLVGADGAISESPIQTRAGPAADAVEVLSGLRLGDVLTPAEAAR
ncbi:RND transporter [Caulobacter sp. Root1455]|jgi:RND family efflux transporter MFP subunit|uniref:efflux RND transporter periplasmic adaptor subunit n=1 Tax=unclassified Caulobacter TaxID=2648921 RepID=UPI0006F64A58|nr:MULTISPECIES: efflux RND transporter periplasmic adaptor subunit [unclassified Caulobacter]KQY26423.1 RND transporter [Caulobacter sp. Root487D2Y]KQY91403.1 RND transporter [Caulobacter sp. Root1455]